MFRLCLSESFGYLHVFIRAQEPSMRWRWDLGVAVLKFNCWWPFCPVVSCCVLFTDGLARPARLKRPEPWAEPNSAGGKLSFVESEGALMRNVGGVTT
jgi:hypothetical protein